MPTLPPSFKKKPILLFSSAIDIALPFWALIESLESADEILPNSILFLKKLI